MENKFAKQWDEIGGTTEANKAVATELWEHPNYFNLSGIFSVSKALQDLYSIFGNQLHWKAFLELGCGTGRETKYFADIFYNMTAIDYSENMIKKAKERVTADNVNFSKNDGENIPSVDESFDIVYSYIVLQHCHKEVVLSYFKEVKRVLKKGGIFMFQIHIGEEHKEPVDFLSYSYWTMDEINEEFKDFNCIRPPKIDSMDFIIYEKL